jgi:hypothetical protein
LFGLTTYIGFTLYASDHMTLALYQLRVRLLESSWAYRCFSATVPYQGLDLLVLISDLTFTQEGFEPSVYTN